MALAGQRAETDRRDPFHLRHRRREFRRLLGDDLSREHLDQVAPTAYYQARQVSDDAPVAVFLVHALVVYRAIASCSAPKSHQRSETSMEARK